MLKGHGFDRVEGKGRCRVDRCALFVDAGYLLADGAMAVHGTRNRDSVSWDYPGLVRLLNEIAHDRTGLPLLRCYWYEATVDGRRNQEQDGIADIPGVKVRAARIRPGRREGVESYVQRDITTLARSGVLCEAVLVSGDEDMAPVVADVQDLGVRVSVVHVAVEGSWTIARELRRECDDRIEVGAGHLRPHVNLIAGPADSPTDTTVRLGEAPMANGRARAASGVVARHPVAAHPGDARMDPASAGNSAIYGNTGGQPAYGNTGGQPAYGNTSAQPASGANAAEQLRAMQQSIAQRRTGDHLAPQATSPAVEPGSDDQIRGFGTGAHQSHADGFRGSGPSGNPSAPQPSRAGPNPPTGANPSHSGHPHPPTGANPSLANPGAGPEQTVRLRPQGYGPSGPPPGRQPTGGHHTPPATGPAQYEPEVPPHPRGAPPGHDPQYGSNGDPRTGGNSDPNPTYGASSEASGFGGADENSSLSHPATGPGPSPRMPRHGPSTNPTPHIGHVSAAQSAVQSAADAVAVAHREGSEFAESISKDAQALWIEAVLARRPAMPSDLEARLLQGSALPIDCLLRDEVRQALRDGFWRALENARP